jgi:AraC family transcriptional regulator
MSSRLEIVVAGRRQVALLTTPELSSGTSPWTGFLVEAHRLSTFEMPDHWIPFYMIGLQIVEGTGRRFFFEGGKYHECPFENGDCFVVAPHELRRFRCEAKARVVFVSIDPVVLQDMVACSPSRSPFELTRNWNGQDPALRNLVLRLQEEVTSGCPSGPLLGESICTRLAEELVERYSIGRPRLDSYKGGLSGAQLRRAVEYIEEYLNLNLSASDIAGIAGLSQYHFGKAFRHSTGMTVHNYVLARRMRRSQELLVKSDLPLAAIAQASGFSNQAHFTAVFSTRIGIAPGSYRSLRRVSVTVNANAAAGLQNIRSILKDSQRSSGLYSRQ